MQFHRIDRITVEGFWGDHVVETQVFPDVTFFIGVNGTGKTTLINLVAAALVCDFEALDKIAFKRIEIVLSPITGTKKPSIVATKKQNKKSPFPQIDYELRASQSSDPQRFSLDDVQEQLFLRRQHLPSSSAVRRDMYRHYGSSILEKMRELVQVSWLSIHRVTPGARGEDRAYESSVDRKIEQLNNELVRFFSSLSKQRDDEVRKFQEYIFLSLLEIPSAPPSFAMKADQSDTARADLKQIFSELHLSSDDTDQKIEKFFSRINEVASQSTNENAIKIDDFVFMLGVSRIDSLVRLWRDLKKRSDDILSPRDRFIDILNSMLQGKRAEIGESNEVLFRTSQHVLTPFMLSSGEKQLFILLGEVLLQRNQACVFVADEPELSLHVTWQERLIASLRLLNSSSQILAATHSPDIVGSLHHNAIDMESILK
jgi:predicted ATPase